MRIDFKNKKVTVMGLGLFGGGLSAVNWLIKHGAKVTVTDLKPASQLAGSLKQIKGRPKLVLGRHCRADFIKADYIIQNPGVPKESEFLALAKSRKIAVENEASLFFKHCPGAIIGVTGTRGKSTTATLIFELLKAKSLKLEAKVYLAGQPQNPMLDILDRIRPNDLTVLELSSWQLEIVGEHELSPQISILTNIYPDHLNRYRDMAEYARAKAQIFLYQNSNDLAVFNLDNPEAKKMGSLACGHRFWFSKKKFSGENGVFSDRGGIYFRLFGQTEKLASVKDLKLPGEHNLENALAALAVAGVMDVPASKIKKTLRNFCGLHSRQELIRVIGGVKYVNDTTATTPDGTMAALETFKKNIVLIAGGETKNLPDDKYRQLARLIEKTCRAVILLEGPASNQLRKFLKIKNIADQVVKMSDAVGLAESFAQKGDTILLSPAASSFNLFVNEYDRGEQFNRIVRGIRP